MTWHDEIDEAIGTESCPIHGRDRDELALILYSRMLSRRPVWVDSPMGQMRWVSMIGVDDAGEVVVYDSDGQDRSPKSYLLTSPAAGVVSVAKCTRGM